MSAETVFYDGACGFCHRSVQFILARDEAGAFRFAPLEGETFRERVGEETGRALPDSLVVLTDDGRLLTRTDATVHLLRRLGGLWRVLGALLALVPRAARDAAYDAFARNRHRLFERPEASCPVLPAPLRARFDP